MSRLITYVSEDSFLQALELLRDIDSRHYEALSPFDIRSRPEFAGHENALNIVKFSGLMGALTGVATGVLLVSYSAIVDAPLNVGGRPLNSWPVAVPITWILTVLFTGLAGFGAFLWKLKFPQPYHPVFDHPAFEMQKNQFYIFLNDSIDPGVLP